MDSRSAFLMGLGVGAALALLFAPQSGRKTQRFVSQKVQKGLDQMAAAGKHVGTEIKDWADRGEEQVAESLVAENKRA
jgi:gas vesicle protein